MCGAESRQLHDAAPKQAKLGRDSAGKTPDEQEKLP